MTALENEGALRVWYRVRPTLDSVRGSRRAYAQDLIREGENLVPALRDSANAPRALRQMRLLLAACAGTGKHCPIVVARVFPNEERPT